MQAHTICYHSDMRTTISLPEPLLENAKQHAAERGVTLSVVLEDALRRFLARSTSASTASFRLHTVRGKLVDPHLDLDRTSELLSKDEEESFRHGQR
jgi:hypothetical protein